MAIVGLVIKICSREVWIILGVRTYCDIYFSGFQICCWIKETVRVILAEMSPLAVSQWPNTLSHTARLLWGSIWFVTICLHLSDMLSFIWRTQHQVYSMSVVCASVCLLYTYTCMLLIFHICVPAHAQTCAPLEQWSANPRCWLRELCPAFSFLSFTQQPARQLFTPPLWCL